MNNESDDRREYEPDEDNGRRRGRNRDRDEDYDRDSPRGSLTRSVWMAFLAVGCGLFLLCGGLIGLAVFWGARSFTTDIPTAQAVADEFLDRLRNDKIDDAYALTSPEFRAEKSPEQFAEFVKKFDTFTHQTSRTQNGFRLLHDGSGKHVFIQTTLHSPNNAMTCTGADRRGRSLEGGKDHRAVNAEFQAPLFQ